jgi:hypothetical protein
MGVDDVTCPRDAQQFADTSGGGLIQGSDLGAAEQASQIRLPRHAAPDLSNDPTAGDRGCATHLVTSNQRPDVAVLALNGDKCARVENQGHSASQPGRACCRLLFSLIKDPISFRKLLIGQGAFFSLPRSERFPEALIPEAGFDCLGDPAGYADAAFARRFAHFTSELGTNGYGQPIYRHADIFAHDRVHVVSFCCDTRDTWRQQAAAQHTLRNAFPVEVWRNAAEVERPAGTEDQAQIDIHRR